MSKYSKYGRELDELMRQRFSEFEKAEGEYKKAKKDHELHPVRSGITSYPDQVKALKYQVAFTEAESKYKEALKVLKGIPDEARAIRSALYNELKSDLSVKPEDLDGSVVALLTSGICTPEEVSKMFDKAENVTTKRYIASYADKVDTKEMKSGDARVYRNVAHNGRHLYDPETHDALQKFDVALDVVNRCSKNTAMIGYWGQLTEEPLSDM